MTPGIRPPINRPPTLTSESHPYITIATLGGIIGPITEEAPVMPVLYFIGYP